MESWFGFRNRCGIAGTGASVREIRLDRRWAVRSVVVVSLPSRVSVRRRGREGVDSAGECGTADAAPAAPFGTGLAPCGSREPLLSTRESVMLGVAGRQAHALQQWWDVVALCGATW